MVDKKKKEETHPGLAISAYFLKRYPKTSKRVHLGPINSDDLWEFLREMDKDEKETREKMEQSNVIFR